MKPRVIAIIQGRMASSRLPGKILLDISGKPMLAWVFNRTSRSGSVDEVIFATTVDSSDDPVVAYCAEHGIPFSRGSQYDVLDRFHQILRIHTADVIVRITADCPLIDPDVIDAAVNVLIQDGYDFVCNRLPPPYQRTYPIGLDVEVCSFAALEKAWTTSSEAQHREHVMPYLYEGVRFSWVNPVLEAGLSKRGFKIAMIHHPVDYGTYRWTVDTAEDLEFVRQVCGRFNERDDFSWIEVLQLVQAEPKLMEINAGIQHKTLNDIDTRALGG